MSAAHADIELEAIKCNPARDDGSSEGYLRRLYVSSRVHVLPTIEDWARVEQCSIVPLQTIHDLIVPTFGHARRLYVYAY